MHKDRILEVAWDIEDRGRIASPELDVMSTRLATHVIAMYNDKHTYSEIHPFPFEFAAAKELMLNGEQMMELFKPQEFFTWQQAVKTLRHLAETGRVNWDA